MVVPVLSVSFPVFNEEGNIGPLLDEALAELGRIAPSFEIVVVDDGSADRSAEIVRGYAQEHNNIRLVVHPTNLGYGHALRSGLQHSRGDLVALIDGDRQFRIADLGALVEAMDSSDVVLAYRIKRADPPHRLFIARVYHLVLRATLGLHLRDVDCGMKLYKREVINRILPELESGGAFVSPELAMRAQHAGFRITEVGVPHHPRIAGRSKGATPRVVARTLKDIVKLRRTLSTS